MNPPDLPACKDPVGLCLWVITSVAPLYNIQSGDTDIVSFKDFQGLISCKYDYLIVKKGMSFACYGNGNVQYLV